MLKKVGAFNLNKNNLSSSALESIFTRVVSKPLINLFANIFNQITNASVGAFCVRLKSIG